MGSSVLRVVSLTLLLCTPVAGGAPVLAGEPPPTAPPRPVLFAPLEVPRAFAARERLLRDVVSARMIANGRYTEAVSAQTERQIEGCVRQVNRDGTDESCWIRIGQGQGAQVMVSGEITGSEKSCSISLRRTELETRLTTNKVVRLLAPCGFDALLAELEVAGARLAGEADHEPTVARAATPPVAPVAAPGTTPPAPVAPPAAPAVAPPVVVTPPPTAPVAPLPKPTPPTAAPVAAQGPSNEPAVASLPAPSPDAGLVAAPRTPRLLGDPLFLGGGLVALAGGLGAGLGWSMASKGREEADAATTTDELADADGRITTGNLLQLGGWIVAGVAVGVCGWRWLTFTSADDGGAAAVAWSATGGPGWIALGGQF
ncbi:MAG: hypothetical protein RBU45_21820 [Myxococcota bacterium]|nr:hypothetical protein [Myxococcota bacterium]